MLGQRLRQPMRVLALNRTLEHRWSFSGEHIQPPNLKVSEMQTRLFGDKPFRRDHNIQGFRHIDWSQVQSSETIQHTPKRNTVQCGFAVGATLF